MFLNIPPRSFKKRFDEIQSPLKDPSSKILFNQFIRRQGLNNTSTFPQKRLS